MQWAKKIDNTIGFPGTENGKKSVVDRNGNLYLSGVITGQSVDIDPGVGTFLLSSAGLNDSFLAKYDKDGNRLELTSYDPKGKMISNLKSTYVDGKITKEETILANGLVDVSSEIKTDAKGNRVEQRDTKTDAVSPLFNFTQLYKYDEKGQMIERTSLRGNGTLMYRYLFKYDDKGNRVEWIQIGANGLMVGRVTYKFDEKNNLVEEISHDSNNIPKATYTYTYEFDKKGNWTRRTKLENNTAIEIKERNYNYQ